MISPGITPTFDKGPKLERKEVGTKPTSEMKKACEILKNEISQALIF